MDRNRLKGHFHILELILVLAVSFLLSGCGKTDSIRETPVTELTVAWWGNDDRHIYTMDALDKYAEQRQGLVNINSKYGSWKGQENRMRVYMKSKNTPDVMLINYNWIDEYSPDGYGFFDLYMLTSVLDLSQFSDEDLAYGRKNGKLNAIPIAMNTQTIFLNKTLWNEYGLDLPETWNDYFQAAKVMSEEGVFPLSMTKKSAFFFVLAHQIQSNGEDARFEDGMLILSRKDIREMLIFYRKLIDEKVLQPVDQFSRNDFSVGKVAGTMAWISDAGNYCQTLSESGAEVAVGEYPRRPDVDVLGWYEKPATMYAISAETENPREAGLLLNYLVNSEEMTLLQKTEKGIPISKAARDILVKKNMLEGFEVDADEMRKNHSEDMRRMEPILESEQIYDVFKKEADYYLYDKKTLAEVTDAIYTSYYGAKEKEKEE